MNNFWKATLIRCIRTFLTTILGVWTAGTLITDIDWKTTIVAAFSATVYIGITCIVAGLPEVEYKRYLNDELEGEEDPDDDEIEEEYHDD